MVGDRLGDELRPLEGTSWTLSSSQDGLASAEQALGTGDGLFSLSAPVGGVVVAVPPRGHDQHGRVEGGEYLAGPVVPQRVDDFEVVGVAEPRPDGPSGWTSKLAVTISSRPGLNSNPQSRCGPSRGIGRW